ncbi:hypothetical protein [Anditalea andensis]|uniref:Uncharacterized protein n=1 Tax=Anditalea andensis TaxID=1048983 RepID=A0A074L296_9BACT|nr:hypothetical protein [Anditalea andensis]KEO73993.1 hypothetical protein EL17_07525 [Anditalea andensis]
MKIASLAEIKKNLKELSEKELIELITLLAKANVDNKKFLFFQLYGRENPNLYSEMVEEELELEFQKANAYNYHSAKKASQKIRRIMNKLLKYNKDKATQLEVIAFFCEKMVENGYLRHRHQVIENLFRVQVGKIEKLQMALHEDLQYDYQERIDVLKKYI